MKREEMEKHIGRRFDHHGTLYDIIGIMKSVGGNLSFAVSKVLGTSVVGYIPYAAIDLADEYEHGDNIEDPADDIMVVCTSTIVVNVSAYEEAPTAFVEALQLGLDDDIGLRFDCRRQHGPDWRARVVVNGEIVGVLPGPVSDGD